jgi:hypothetical protein
MQSRITAVFGRAAESQLVVCQLVLFLLKSFSSVLLVIFLLIIFLGPRAIADNWLFMELPFSLAATLCSRRSSMCKSCEDIVNGSFFICPVD